jgi:hypothetical protein
MTLRDAITTGKLEFESAFRRRGMRNWSRSIAAV